MWTIRMPTILTREVGMNFELDLCRSLRNTELSMWTESRWDKKKIPNALQIIKRVKDTGQANVQRKKIILSLFIL